MKTLERLVAEKLLKVKAVKLQPANPFTWASGWKSPIYCDNRKTLSYPAVRSFIKLELARTICEQYEEANAIAGVATGAIAQGALVADILDLPFVYVRSAPKDHGFENTVLFQENSCCNHRWRSRFLPHRANCYAKARHPPWPA